MLLEARDKIQQAPVTFALLAIILVWYIVELSSFSKNGSVEGFRYWFLMESVYPSSPGWFFSVLSHAGYIHLFTNVVIIGLFGIGVERYLGSYRFLGFTLISGYGANISQAAYRELSNQIIAVGGASGVGYALLVYFPLLHYRNNPYRGPKQAVNRMFEGTATREDEIDLILFFSLLVAFLIPVFEITDILDAGRSGSVGHLVAAVIGGAIFLASNQFWNEIRTTK